MSFKKTASVIVAGLMTIVALAGCGGPKGPEASKKINVNTYKVVVEDTRISSEYPGSVIARQNVAIRSRVTGNVVEKYVKGGDYVVKGQPLYRIDSRPYDSTLAAAQAKAAEARAAAYNAEVDLHRYEVLAQNDAIAQQVLDAQQVKATSTQSMYEAAEAQVRIANDNVGDTIIRAPFSGTLGMDDVALGTFVSAGQVPLVTIQSTNPVYVKFSMSEDQYLEYKKESTDGLGDLTLKLSDHSIYPQKGHLVEVSKNLDGGSGQIMMKAEFENPNNLLLAGMFASVITDSKEVKNAILVPTKSLVQVLDKTFVMVVGADNKIKQIPVTKSATQGYFTLVKGDIKSGDQVVVDGLTKVKAGSEVIPKILTKAEIEKGE